MSFTFSHPQYLFFLFAIPLIVFIHFFSLGNKKKHALKFANFDAIARIEGVDFFSKNVVLLFLNLLIVILLVFSVSGLTLHTTRESSSFSYVLAVDSSQSMEADDVFPNRINAAKDAAIDFIDKAPFGIRAGVISFGGGSKIEIEVTQRKDEIKSAIRSIGIGGYGGTDIYEAVLTSANTLKGESAKSIILLSDGQINVGSIDDAIDYANKNDVIVNTIGIGTVEGGNTEYSFSKLDEDSLKSLAYNTGGTYFSGNDAENLSKSFSGILDLTEKKVSIELFDYLVMAALILLVISFFLSNTKYVSLP